MYTLGSVLTYDERASTLWGLSPPSVCRTADADGPSIIATFSSMHVALMAITQSLGAYIKYVRTERGRGSKN